MGGKNRGIGGSLSGFTRSGENCLFSLEPNCTKPTAEKDFGAVGFVHPWAFVPALRLYSSPLRCRGCGVPLRSGSPSAYIHNCGIKLSLNPFSRVLLLPYAAAHKDAHNGFLCHLAAGRMFAGPKVHHGAC